MIKGEKVTFEEISPEVCETRYEGTYLGESTVDNSTGKVQYRCAVIKRTQRVKHKATGEWRLNTQEWTEGSPYLMWLSEIYLK